MADLFFFVVFVFVARANQKIWNLALGRKSTRRPVGLKLSLCFVWDEGFRGFVYFPQS
jgi:hypothetical protein